MESIDFSTESLLLYFIIFGSVALTITLNYIIFKKLRQFFELSSLSSEKIERIKRSLKKPLWLFLVTLSIFIPISYSKIAFDYQSSLRHTLLIILIISVTWLLIKMLNIANIFIINKYEYVGSDNLSARKALTRYDIIEKIGVALLVLLGFASVLMTFEAIRQIGVSLFASAGVIGVIIGFAAQKLIGIFLAGIQIALTQPIRIDDVVIVENEWGWIEEIHLTYVVIRIWDKRRLVVPTTYFIEKPFQNWTRNSSDILGTVFINTDYSFPVDKLRYKLDEILKETTLWDGKVCNVQVTNIKDRNLEIRVLLSAVDSPKAWDLRVFVREKLVEFIAKDFPENLPKTRINLNEIKEAPSV